MKTVCVGLILFFVCQPSAKPPDAIRGFCSTAQVIKASRRDTAETLAAIRSHNKKISKLCKR